MEKTGKCKRCHNDARLLTNGLCVSCDYILYGLDTQDIEEET